ncbi:TonB-dependent receptor [Candidatus Chrysopegis kryptomonas]|uniref:Iron complex outermembrane recepter protein n=1 Tax=Candidatus Chryseopegocella kryptomonas TaxID=1633643 RepID=A0A0P1NVH6_9BACT|nr:TonB-dependent receptor [Candidatus Chrysopegis kryptomonas]CUT03218.1 iron complex outermembrane recepter protein [Candidatus Chrysopegis kryptomonas]
MRRAIFTLVVFIFVSFQISFAQEKATIRGFVYDSKAKYPLVNANIWIEGTNRGDVSDFKGYFEIKNLAPGNYNLVVSYVGYKQTKEQIQLKSGEVKTVEVYLEELPYFSVEEIVVLGRPAETYNQAEIGGREIMKKAPRDLGDFVRNFSNTSAIKKGGYALDPVVRGTKFDQINVQIDNGVKIEAACPNRMDPPTSHVQAEDLEKIEILKGPYALRYGPNIGGVMNFVLAKPKRFEKFSIGGNIETGYESNWNGKVARLTLFGGQRLFDFRIAGGVKDYKNYKDGDGNEIQSSFKIRDWTGKFGVNLGDNHRVQFSIRETYARDVLYPALPMDGRKDDSRIISIDYGARNLNSLINSVNLKAYYSKVYHLMDNEFKPTRLNVDAVTEANTKVTGGRGEAGLIFGNNLLYVGFDYAKVEKDGFRTRKMKTGPMAGKTFIDTVWQNSYVSNFGIFGEFRTGIYGFNLMLSARYDVNYAQARTPAPSFAKLFGNLSSKFHNFSFSGGLDKAITPNVQLTILAGSAKRSPNISERFINFLPIGIDNYDYVGNPSIKPETNNSIDLILKSKVIGGIFKGDVFYYYVKNFISAKIRSDLTPKNMGVRGVKQFVNIDRAKFFGFELGYTSTFSRTFGFDLNIYQTKAWDAVTGEALPEIPPFEAKTVVYYNFFDGKIRPELTIRAVARKSDVSTSFGETSTPGFVLVNFLVDIVYFKFADISVGVNNLFDKAYYEHLNRKIRTSGIPIYEPGRNFFINITMKVGE